MVSNFSRGLDGVTGAQYVLNLGFAPNAGYLLPETPAQAGDPHMRVVLKAMNAPASNFAVCRALSGFLMSHQRTVLPCGPAAYHVRFSHS